MNERIKELAKQAYEDCFEDSYCPNYSTDRLYAKFAELILANSDQLKTYRDPINKPFVINPATISKMTAKASDMRHMYGPSWGFGKK